MASDIEQIIESMEQFIEEKGKVSAFSPNKISLNKDELEGYLEELKAATPDEIRRYQKIINNKDAIIADARKKAQQIIEQAQVKTDELVSEHQIMQQAYAQANQVVMIATKNAQEMLDKATMESNEIKSSAIAYTDELLAGVQSVLSNSLDLARMRNQNFIDKLQDVLNQVVENRQELLPPEEAPEQADNAGNASENADPNAASGDAANTGDPANGQAGGAGAQNPQAANAGQSQEEGPSIDVLPEEYFKHNKK